VTDRLYYTDAYRSTFDATVTRSFEHEGRPAVTLDRTAFYPTSGGQPFDTGRLARRAERAEQILPTSQGLGRQPRDTEGEPLAGSVEVVETVDGSDIVHVLAAPLPAGTVVSGTIEWPRRFDHMQQHTGQHLLSAACDRLFENQTVGFHMGAEVSTIDLAREAPWRDVEHASDLANDVVWEDRSIAVRLVSPGEAAALALRKDPTREGPLRLVEIDRFDVCPCGGTHVARTGAVGVVAVLRAERLRGGTRLTFVCGGRAVRALRTYRDAVTGSVQTLSVLPAELPAAVERLQAEARDLQKRVRELKTRLAGYDGIRLFSEAPEFNGLRVVVRVVPDADGGDLKALALGVIAAGRAAVVLLSSTPPLSAVVARSDGVALDAQGLLRQLLDRFGGRGGGTADLAQGGGLNASPLEVVSTARELITPAIG